jgi:hypothetical protein
MMKWGAAGTVTVTVNDQEWRLVPDLQQAGSSDAVYFLDRETGSIRFGDGVHGAIPQIGSTVSVSYCYGGRSAGNISKSIDKHDDVERFWILVRDSQQVLGWGRLTVELHQSLKRSTGVETNS